MRSPVSCELGTCSISSESSPSTIWGAAAIPPGLHEPVWAELDRHALRLFGPRRKPVREGQGLLRKQRRRTDPPIAGLAPSRARTSPAWRSDTARGRPSRGGLLDTIWIASLTRTA